MEYLPQIAREVRSVFGDVQDPVLLVGSRALGNAVSTSDFDVVIPTNNYEYYRNIVVSKGLRTESEDAGIDMKFIDNLFLEVKAIPDNYKLYDMFMLFDILNSVPIMHGDAFKSKVSGRFDELYEMLLMQEYVSLFNDFNALSGAIKRRSDDLTVAICKYQVITSMLRVVILSYRRPYPYDKHLVYVARQCTAGKEAMEFVAKLEQVKTYEEERLLKPQIKKFIDGLMPQRPYVGVWWKYLSKIRFKERAVL